MSVVKQLVGGNNMSKFFDDTMQSLLEAASWDYMNPPEEKKEEKLKRCPFCGGEAKLVTKRDCLSDTNYIYILCTGCGVQTQSVISDIHLQNIYHDYDYCLSNFRTIVKVWNTRKPVENILDRLKEMFKHHNATKTVQRLVLETVEEELL